MQYDVGCDMRLEMLSGEAANWQPCITSRGSYMRLLMELEKRLGHTDWV